MSDLNNETKPLNSIESVHLISYGTDDDRNHLIHENDRASTTSTTSLPQFLGHKATIGMMGSISIAVNSITGPAMVDLPATFQRSGWIPTIVTLLFVCVLSSLCSLHLADTISKYPGNLNFEREVEFSESFRYFWGHRWFVVTEILFFVCITCLNMSSIVDTAQVVDTFFGHFFGFSSALHITSTHQNLEVVHWYPAECTAETLMAGECLAFADHADGILLTLGYVITTFIFLPMALMDLKENSVFQIMGFLVLIATVIQFAIEFGLSGLDFNNMSLWGSSWDALLGVVLFNFALVIAIPAWLYEKHSSVSVPVVVHGASMLSSLLYIIVGAMGALAIPNVSDNMLESMMSGSFGITMQAGSILFAFMIIGLGIPLFSVLTRMNLTGSGLTSHLVGNLLAVYFPFSVSWILYQGDLVTELLSWGGVIFTSAVAFILPLILALHTVWEFDLVGSIEVYGPCWKQEFQSRRTKIVALVIILSLTVMAVVSAIVGQFWIMDDDETPSALPRVG